MNDPIKYDCAKILAVIKRLPARVAVVTENFSKARFREQGWRDTTAQPWAKRKRETSSDNGRAILVATGELRRSIHARARDMTIMVYSDKPYAQAHNEGVSDTVTDRVSEHNRRSHSRKAYTRADGRAVAAATVAAHTVGGFTRKRNMNLPKRQFIGQSAALDKEITTTLEKSINMAIKQGR